MKAIRRAAALIDGTALYFRSREGRGERLDYEALNRDLISRAGVPSFDPALFFTTYDAQNEGQAKFLSFLRTRVHWKEEPRAVWDADPLPSGLRSELGDRRNEFIRFDAPIAFALGRLLERRDRIVIVTDSFALAQPMLAAGEYNAAEIVLAFFGHQLDTRWLRALREADDKVKFWDLDESNEPLFGRETVVRTSSSTSLGSLK